MKDWRKGLMTMNKPHGKLHNHPKLEKELNLNHEHVIVDRSDWEEILELKKVNNARNNTNSKCEICNTDVCFERHDPETQPPEYDICEMCDSHVCPDCMVGDICKSCSKEAEHIPVYDELTSLKILLQEYPKGSHIYNHTLKRIKEIKQGGRT